MRNIYVYGDSISLGWEIPFQEFIKKEYEYHRIGKDGQVCGVGYLECNGESSKEMIRCIESGCFIDKVKPDSILLFNCGLHDIKCSKDRLSYNVTIEKYEENLSMICSMVKAMFKEVLWITTTPIDDTIHNSFDLGFYRYNEDVRRYNKCAEQTVKKYGFRIIDLYSFTQKIVNENSIYIDHVHMKDEIAKRQAEYIFSLV